MNEKEILILQSYRSDAHLPLNKEMIKALGIGLAVFTASLLDKLDYFIKEDRLNEEDGFYTQHWRQMKDLNIHEKTIRRYKKKLKDIGVLTTKMEKAPAKEFYYLNLEKLDQIIRENKSEDETNPNQDPFQTETPGDTQKGTHEGAQKGGTSGTQKRRSKGTQKGGTSGAQKGRPYIEKHIRKTHSIKSSNKLLQMENLEGFPDGGVGNLFDGSKPSSNDNKSKSSQSKRRRKWPASQQKSKCSAASQQKSKRSTAKKPSNSSKKKKPQTIQDLPDYSEKNLEMVNFWNKRCSKKGHQLKPTKTIKNIFKKLNWLRNGQLNSKAVLIKNGVPDSEFDREFNQREIKRGLRFYFDALKEGNYPQEKDWLKNLSLDTYLYNERTNKSHFVSFSYYGIKPMPHTKLEGENQKRAFQIFKDHFKKYTNNGNGADHKIIELVKKLDKKDYSPRKFASSITSILEGQGFVGNVLYNTLDFELNKSKHSPYSLIPEKNTVTMDTIYNAYEMVYGTNFLDEVRKQSEEELERAKRKESEERQAARIINGLHELDDEGLFDLGFYYNENGSVFYGLEVNGHIVTKGHNTPKPDLYVDRQNKTVWYKGEVIASPSPPKGEVQGCPKGKD